jgi:hypothetical protein
MEPKFANDIHFYFNTSQMVYVLQANTRYLAMEI